MSVVMVIAIAVVLIAAVFVSMGLGGELSVERPDYVPPELGPVSATDVALLRPPGGLWGYNMQATDEALARIAESVRERDVRIVALEQLVTDLSREHLPSPPLSSPPYPGARHRRDEGEPQEAGWAYGTGRTAEAGPAEERSGEAGPDEARPADGPLPPERAHD